MPMQRYSDQQVLLNGMIYNSLRRPNPPILETIQPQHYMEVYNHENLCCINTVDHLWRMSK